MHAVSVVAFFAVHVVLGVPRLGDGRYHVARKERVVGDPDGFVDGARRAVSSIGAAGRLHVMQTARVDKRAPGLVPRGGHPLLELALQRHGLPEHAERSEGHGLGERAKARRSWVCIPCLHRWRSASARCGRERFEPNQTNPLPHQRLRSHRLGVHPAVTGRAHTGPAGSAFQRRGAFFWFPCFGAAAAALRLFPHRRRKRQVAHVGTFRGESFAGPTTDAPAATDVERVEQQGHDFP
mmetsp:Transcript_39192/g.72089  ORF Transcript_39192/g.72089 Transcript_39192/m.72089 type:complete len:238 (-) Transcript_39192:5-718(-)